MPGFQNLSSIRIRSVHRRRSRLSTFLVVTRRTFAVAVIAVIATAGVGVASAVPSEPRAAAAVSAPERYTNIALVKKLAEYDAELDIFSETLVGAAPASTTLNELEAAAATAIADARVAAKTDVVIRLAVFGSMMDPNEREALETEAVEAAANSTGFADEAVASWTAEVKAENARVAAAKAEAERVAAAKAAAAASSSNSGSSAWVSAGGSESFAQRVARMAATLPFHVNYSISNSCDQSNALGCFQPSNGAIYVTSLAASYRDCTIRNMLAHEYRHQQQSNQGSIQISNGQITNRDWLESDAYAFGNQYGC